MGNGMEPLDRTKLIKMFKRDCRRVRDGCNFDISKCFKDGKPLIIDGTHVDPEQYLELVHNPQTGQSEYRIKSETTEFPPGQENEALLAMQHKMQAIDQTGSLIIPFLLTIDSVSHTQCVENRLSMLFQKNGDNLPEDIDGFLERKLSEQQMIQDYLREACGKLNFTELAIDINKFDATIDRMHDIVLEAIECGE